MSTFIASLHFLPGSKIVSKDDLEKLWNTNHIKSQYPDFDQWVKSVSPKLEQREADQDIECLTQNRIKDAFLDDVMDLTSSLYTTVESNASADHVKNIKRFKEKVKMSDRSSTKTFCKTMKWNENEDNQCAYRANPFPLEDTIVGQQWALGRVSTLQDGDYYCSNKFLTLMSDCWDYRDMIENDAYISCVMQDCMRDFGQNTFAARIVLSDYYKSYLPQYGTFTQPGDVYAKVLHREICQLDNLTIWQSREYPTILFLAKRGEKKNTKRFWKVR